MPLPCHSPVLAFRFGQPQCLLHHRNRPNLPRIEPLRALATTPLQCAWLQFLFFLSNHECNPRVPQAWVRYAKFEMQNGEVGLARRCYERAVDELGEDAQTVRLRGPRGLAGGAPGIG